MTARGSARPLSTFTIMRGIRATEYTAAERIGNHMQDAEQMPQPTPGSAAAAAKGPTRPATGPTGRVADTHARTRYGILGGTLDPPHVGHLMLAQEAYARLGLEKVWFVPVGTPPHKPNQPITAATHRLAMVERAIANDDRFAVSSVELDRPGPSYTVETLRRLRAAWGPSVALYFVLGWDMLLYLPLWKDPAGMLATLDGLLAVHRPGFTADVHVVEELEGRIPGLREKLLLTPMPQVAISSTDIRQRVALSLPIRYMVPDTVCQYIEQHGLYRADADQAAQGRRIAAQLEKKPGEESA
jgi:nicotinate-nucleotide adenylyltransferase